MPKVMTLAGRDEHAICRTLAAVLKRDIGFFVTVYNDQLTDDGCTPIAEPLKSYRYVQRGEDELVVVDDSPELLIYTDTSEQAEVQYANGVFEYNIYLALTTVAGLLQDAIIKEKYEVIGERGSTLNANNTDETRTITGSEVAQYRASITANIIMDILNRYCGRQPLVPAIKIKNIISLTYQSHTFSDVEELQNSLFAIDALLIYRVQVQNKLVTV